MKFGFNYKILISLIIFVFFLLLIVWSINLINFQNNFSQNTSKSSFLENSSVISKSYYFSLYSQDLSSTESFNKSVSSDKNIVSSISEKSFSSSVKSSFNSQGRGNYEQNIDAFRD